MKNNLEKTVVKVLTIVVIVVFLSACGSSRPYHACGITPLNKQYSTSHR